MIMLARVYLNGEIPRATSCDSVLHEASQVASLLKFSLEAIRNNYKESKPYLNVTEVS